MDKTTQIIKYLADCPAIANCPLFFNFAEEVDDNKQLVTVATDKAVERPYIDGSVLKRYTITLIDYRSIAYQALVMQEGFPNENVEELLDVQSIIDWVNDKNDKMEFPDFGEDCIVEEIIPLTDTPNLLGVDSDSSPSIAKYSIAIRVQYLDKSRMIWK